MISLKGLEMLMLESVDLRAIPFEYTWGGGTLTY